MKPKSTYYLNLFLIILTGLFIFISCDNNDSNENDENETQTETGEVIDYEGNTYETVKIGNQWWMAENLKVKKYRNGEAIPNVSDNIEWSNLTSGAFTWYKNDYDSLGKSYGALYNWYTIEDERGLCPEDWHVPNDSEWKQLIDYLDGVIYAGGKMKSTISEPSLHPRWKSPNQSANNISGFSAFPGGFRNPSDGEYYYLGEDGYWWSSDEWTNVDDYLAICLNYSSISVLSTDIYVNFKSSGYSIRCIKDNN